MSSWAHARIPHAQAFVAVQSRSSKVMCLQAAELRENKHADYLFTVKANQPGLKATIDRLPRTRFPPPHTDTDHGHGRIEHRTIRVSAALQAVTFPHAAQLLVIDRSVRDLDGSCRSVKVAYGVTGLTPEQVDPAQLLGLVRGQ